jgi:hypothetical protein
MKSGKDFGIYVNSETARFHFNQLDVVDAGLRFKFSSTLEEFESADIHPRISAFHIPFPKNQEWLHDFNRAYAVSQQVLIFCSELHEPIVEQFVDLDQPGVHLFVCGTLNYSLQHAQVHLWMDWFHTTTEFYARTQPDFLTSRLDPHQPKPKYFDILLGNQRQHRDTVYNYIKQHQLDHSNIMTYVRYSNQNILNNKEFILDQSDMLFDEDRSYTHSVDSVRYHGRYMNLSQIIPLQVYNQTAYTLVAETNAVNQFNFYTEKIVKPMLGRRLFVVMAGRHYLRNLRAMGFKTFDSVIDEGYDDVEDNVTRWEAALQQAHAIMQQPQQAVLKKIQSTVEHNHRMIAEHNWYQSFLQNLTHVIHTALH